MSRDRIASKLISIDVSSTIYSNYLSSFFCHPFISTCRAIAKVFIPNYEIDCVITSLYHQSLEICLSVALCDSLCSPKALSVIIINIIVISKEISSSMLVPCWKLIEILFQKYFWCCIGQFHTNKSKSTRAQMKMQHNTTIN